MKTVLTIITLVSIVAAQSPSRVGHFKGIVTDVKGSAIYVDRILDRDEFRRLCDSCGRRSEILKRLDAFASQA